MMDILETSALGRLEQEDYCKFKASMGYSVRPWQNKERKEKNKKQAQKFMGGLFKYFDKTET